jgi:hypothetical protein
MRHQAIRLTETELHMAAAIGFGRIVNNRQECFQSPTTYSKPERHQIGNMIFGALAEMAVAKILGGYQQMIFGQRLSSDVIASGYQIEVRSSDSPNGNLLVYPYELNKGCVFALVTGKIPEFTFQGWATSADVQSKSYAFRSKNGKQMHRLLQRDLRPVSELVSLIQNNRHANH